MYISIYISDVRLFLIRLLSPRRCGGGSVEAFEACGVEVTKWDIEETKKGGPFKVWILC